MDNSKACTNLNNLCIISYLKGKGNGKVFNGQEPLTGESTTTVRGVNYQLLAVMLLK